MVGVSRQYNGSDLKKGGDINDELNTVTARDDVLPFDMTAEKRIKRAGRQIVRANVV